MGIYQQSHHHKSNCQKASPVCTQICHLYLRPIYQHSHHHKSNCQKASPATPRFATSMYDQYTSTHTIIRVTAKKRHLLPQDLGPECMTHIPALSQTYIQQTHTQMKTQRETHSHTHTDR